MKFEYYDAERKAKRLKESVRAGYLSRTMISTMVYNDGSIPSYAKEEVIRLALKD